MENQQSFYVLDDEGRPVPEPDYVAWSTWLRNAQRHVAHDFRCGIVISTVFLAINHAYVAGPPILYETMVFGAPDGDDRQRRYATREEALAGHAEVLAEVMSFTVCNKEP